ncbi:MAG: rhodanese-like domain-containing protein [Rhodospirillales bacterium]|nr:rhodanese-like domain-containing protein [Rhodospirillales bacterium]
MITKGYKQLLEEASAVVEEVSMEEVLADKSDDLVLVDLRDVRELDREGMIPGAVHAPRGMLEFWVDPESPYHRDVFAQEDKTYLLYCQSAWRSALAAKTLMDMGMTNVKHIAGGFKGWKESGGPVGERPKKK